MVPTTRSLRSRELIGATTTIPDAVLQFGSTSSLPVLPFKNRLSESQLDYLFPMNVIGLRATLKLKEGPPIIKKDQIEHYIETLDEPELADQLTVLRLADVEELEDVLRARQRTKARRAKILFGSSKSRQKAPSPHGRPREINRRSVHAVRMTRKNQALRTPARKTRTTKGIKGESIRLAGLDDSCRPHESID